jgi:hypothetical protein
MPVTCTDIEKMLVFFSSSAQSSLENGVGHTRADAYWCLIEIIDWRYSQSCWYFRYVGILLTGSPPTLPCVNKYRVRGSGYVESSIQELPVYTVTVYLTRFRTYKPSPFKGQFLRKAEGSHGTSRWRETFIPVTVVQNRFQTI